VKKKRLKKALAIAYEALIGIRCVAAESDRPALERCFERAENALDGVDETLQEKLSVGTLERWRVFS
jgi:hypothetical protein